MIERTSATEFAASVLNYSRCCSIIEHANIQSAHVQETRLA
jgi:hypothetical protein